MTPRQRFTAILFCIFAGTPLFFSLLGHLQSWFWLAALLAQFQLHALVAGLAFFALAIIDKSRLGLILSLALTLSATAAITPVLWHELQAPQAIDTPAAKIINFNVLSTNPDQASVEAWLRAEQPDVVALIEGNYRWKETVERLRDILPHSHMIDHRGNVGMILLSRHPLENIHDYRTKEDYYGAAANNALTIWPIITADVNLPAGKVHFILAHPSVPMTPLKRAMRDAQIHVFGQLVSKSAYPTVLMGDFNTVPWTSSYLDVMRTQKLYGNLLTSSWPAYLHGFGIAIDQILAGKGAVVTNMRTGPVLQSDHRARVAELHLQPAD